ncbi:MAG: hypothetical protein ACFFAL_09205 [Promethearchaeota archaeon]
MKISRFLGILFIASFFCIMIPVTNLVLDPEPTEWSSPPLPNPDGPKILAYIEYADNAGGEEVDNMRTAITNTYGSDYTWTNLTDYTELSTELPYHDILLIPEQENAYNANMTTVGTAWASILDSFINRGGIIISADGRSLPDGSARGVNARLTSAAGLWTYISIHDPGTPLVKVDTSDALGQGTAANWAEPNMCVSYDYVGSHTIVVTDGFDSVVIHAIIGKGHFVHIGFDFWESSSDFENILANAIRLHRHVVFDDSHANGYEIDMEFWGWREDLRAAGFAVSQMDTFTSDYLNASDVLVIAFPNAIYTGGEIAIIEDFVAQGGSLLLIGDYSSYAVEVDPIAEQFGFDFELNLVSLNDTDDFIAATPYWVAYEDTNLIAHPITQGVTRVEFYLSNAVVRKPAEAVDVIITDIDGTSYWSNNTAAPGIPVFSALEYQRGRIVIGTDFNLFSSADDTDADTDLNYYDSDNDVLAMNTIEWLGENRAPVVTVLTPNGGETYETGVETISWSAYDPNNDLIHSYTVSYSPDNGSSWSTIASGLTDTSISWNVTGLLFSPLSLIRVQAMDYGMTGEDISDGVFTVGIFVLPTFPPIPGFPFEAIALGLLLSIGAIFFVRRRRKNPK